MEITVQQYNQAIEKSFRSGYSHGYSSGLDDGHPLSGRYVDRESETWEENKEYLAVSDTAPVMTKDPGYGPSMRGSKNCKSGSVASGGDKTHCSCDICF